MNYIQLPKAAKRVGVNPRTLKDWMLKCGYAMPERQQKGRFLILIPDWMLDKFIAEHSPRIPRASGVVVSHEANR